MIFSPAFSRRQQLLLLTSVCGFGFFSSPAIAQEAAPPLASAQVEDLPEQDPENLDEPRIGTGGEILVQGQRLRGQLDVEQAPLLELGEEDIAAEGVSSITDLITQVTARTGSARGRGGGGRPVVLVNGIRVGSFRQLASYPPEALEKVEVFPEEVALRFGFPPDRRVINLILKDNFASREVEFEFEGPSRGGYFVNEQEFGYLRISPEGRFNINLEANDTSLLTESERDIIQTDGSVSEVASDPDPAQFRSLISDARNLEANVSWAKAIIETGTTLTANVNYDRNDTRALSGLNFVTLIDDATDESVTRTFGQDTPLERRSSTDTFSSSGSFARRVNAFQLNSTFDASLSETETEIDRLFDTDDIEEQAQAGFFALDAALPANADNGFDIARSRTIAAENLTTLRGPLADLPGGELLATFDAGYSWSNLATSDTRTLQDADLTRGTVTTGANLTIPITSRRRGFADALGSFTLNAQVGLDHLSDFGTLGDYNVGLVWEPFDSLNLTATYIVREVAPGLSALGSPTITTFNVPVFDFTNGETVLATVTSGGNPDLLAETQRDWKFAVSWELPFLDGTRFTAEYIRNRSDDVTNSFPQITPEIEAAFPGRITRDATGTLTAVDQRFVTFAETRSDRLQFTLSTRGTFGGGSSGGRGSGRAQERGGPPASAASSERPSDRPPASANSNPAAGPSSDRRAAFMAFRERVCADDGEAFLARLIERVEAGEDVSDELPGFSPRRLQGMLDRARDENGEISPQRLGMIRERICSRDPSAARTGPPGGPAGAPFDRPSPEQMDALRARLCGADGLSAMRDLVGKIERGEDVSPILPGMDPSFLSMMLDRARGDDGTIPDAALERFRSRICESGANGANSGEANGQGQPQPGARRGGSGSLVGAVFGGRGGARRGFRYFANLTHTIELQNEILIAPGLDVLDQLDGDATSAFGLPRHSSRLEAGMFGNGVGMRLSARYTGTTRLNGSGLPGSSDLFFDDLATFNLRLFTNVGQLLGKDSGFAKNLRVSFRADNIFDARRRVTDENGDTPINYQPFVIDPTGRFVGIDIRKLF
ncbi:MAG: hypothetical protein AAGK17_12385 [Pseudomonadota bacterium]